VVAGIVLTKKLFRYLATSVERCFLVCQAIVETRVKRIAVGHALQKQIEQTQLLAKAKKQTAGKLELMDTLPNLKMAKKFFNTVL
jgi:hypothetical protein